MRRRLMILALAGLVLVLLAVGWRSSRAGVSVRVRSDLPELNALAKAVEEAGAVPEGSAYPGYRISYWPGSGMVEFLGVSLGIGSATKYTGFYYSPNDVPLGFQGADVPFTQEGDGWLWKEPGGDNGNYTEKIADCWYWFEMSF